MAKKSISKLKRVCQVEGCEGKHNANGLCIKHDCQMRRYGKILTRTLRDPNEIIIKGNIAEIVLYNVKSEEIARAIIDVEDIEKVKKYKWGLDEGYASTKKNGTRLGIQHIILGTNPKTQWIDHKDRNRLNNRKSNYRLCTRTENIRNVGISKNNTSGHKGVYKGKKSWFASITVNQKQIHIGSFKDKIDAAMAYNTACLKYHGEFACLNEI